jgi:hypothetical protein
MRRLIVTAILLAGCSTGPVEHRSLASADQIMPNHIYFVDESAPSLQAVRQAIDAAIAGDDAKLAYVISVVKYTDGEGAENYGEVLNDLQRAVTPQRFQRVLATLDQNVRTSATASMDVARHNQEAVRKLLRPNQSMQPTAGRSDA